ncbi:hypothetical protein FO519_008557 [Halicephalobus sp. NKZ332]|nr:hypothetical protein FO519_008557 [Halicephalobus sp. NKZ332]
MTDLNSEPSPEMMNNLRREFLHFLNKIAELTSINNLHYEDPVSNKTYKSALVFLRHDIFDIYKQFDSSEELITELRNQLETLKIYEKDLRNPFNSDYTLPDLEGVPIAHYWWRNSIIRPSDREVREYRKLFLDFLVRVAVISDDPCYYTNGLVSDFVWAIFEYTRVRRVVNKEELELWHQKEKEVFVKKFPESIKTLRKYLLPAIQILDSEDPISQKIYRSAINFLHEDIFDLYKAVESSKNLIKEVENQLKSLKDEENHLHEPENSSFLPDLNGVPDSHYWWKK